MDNTYESTKDAGNIIEYYVTKEFGKFLCLKAFEYDAKQLFDINLYIQNNFLAFWNTYDNLEKNYSDPEEELNTEKISIFIAIVELFNNNKE